MAVVLRYFSEFNRFRGALRKSSRSLSHLLMSSCITRQSREPTINQRTDKYSKTVRRNVSNQMGGNTVNGSVWLWSLVFVVSCVKSDIWAAKMRFFATLKGVTCKHELWSDDERAELWVNRYWVCVGSQLKWHGRREKHVWWLRYLRFFGESRPWVAAPVTAGIRVWLDGVGQAGRYGTAERMNRKDLTSPGGHSNQQWYEDRRSTCKDRFDRYLTCCSAVELEAMLRQSPWSSMWMLNGLVRVAVNRRRAQTEVNGVSSAWVWTDEGLWWGSVVAHSAHLQ